MYIYIYTHTYIYVYVYSMCVKLLQLCPTLYNPKEPTRLLCPLDSPGKNTGVGCHALLQGIFLTEGLNRRFLCLKHCRQVLYH